MLPTDGPEAKALLVRDLGLKEPTFNALVRFHGAALNVCPEEAARGMTVAVLVIALTYAIPGVTGAMHREMTAALRRAGFAYPGEGPAESTLWRQII